MDLGLKHKVALVTGGSSGLGLAAASELAAEGAHVAICGRDPARLAAAERQLRRVARGRVSATSVDITDRDAARAWVEHIADEFGALHIALISGASPPSGPATRFAAADYAAAVDLVLLPAVELALAALPHLRAAGWGRLLFMASETASVPVPPLALSGVTRAGIVRFAQGLAADLGRENITVNVIAPGWTRTPLTEGMAARTAPDGDVEAQIAALGAHTAVGRMADPREVAAVAAFLASARASYVTGGVHLIDGGSAVTGPHLPHLTSPAPTAAAPAGPVPTITR